MHAPSRPRSPARRPRRHHPRRRASSTPAGRARSSIWSNRSRHGVVAHPRRPAGEVRARPRCSRARPTPSPTSRSAPAFSSRITRRVRRDQRSHRRRGARAARRAARSTAMCRRSSSAAIPASTSRCCRSTCRGSCRCRSGNSDDLQVGEWLIALGDPFGDEVTASVGVVSATGREAASSLLQGAAMTYRMFIQTDARIQRGNSRRPGAERGRRGRRRRGRDRRSRPASCRS